MGALGDDTIKRMRSIKKQNGYLDVSSDVATGILTERVC